jgi:hypothetical protein
MMHNTKIAIEDAKHVKWCEGCLVISEANAKTIWVYDVQLLQSRLMIDAANIANQAIEKMTDAVC